MRLALSLSYSGASMTLDMPRILEAERLGYDSVWSAEAYGSDAVTPCRSTSPPWDRATSRWPQRSST